MCKGFFYQWHILIQHAISPETQYRLTPFRWLREASERLVQSRTNASQCERLCVCVCACLQGTNTNPQEGLSTAIIRRPQQGHFPENTGYFPNGSNVKKGRTPRSNNLCIWTCMSICECVKIVLAGFLTRRLRRKGTFRGKLCPGVIESLLWVPALRFQCTSVSVSACVFVYEYRWRGNTSCRDSHNVFFFFANFP